MLIRSTQIRQHKTRPLDNLMGFIEYLEFDWPAGEATGTVDLRCIQQLLYHLPTCAVLARKYEASSVMRREAHAWNNTEFFTIADTLLDSMASHLIVSRHINHSKGIMP